MLRSHANPVRASNATKLGECGRDPIRYARGLRQLQHAILSPDMTSLDEFDLNAAVLRHSERDMRAFMAALAVRLETALPGRVTIERKRDGLSEVTSVLQHRRFVPLPHGPTDECRRKKGGHDELHDESVDLGAQRSCITGMTHPISLS